MRFISIGIDVAIKDDEGFYTLIKAWEENGMISKRVVGINYVDDLTESYDGYYDEKTMKELELITENCV